MTLKQQIAEKVFRCCVVPLYPMDKPITEMTSWEQAIHRNIQSYIGESFLLLIKHIKGLKKPVYNEEGLTNEDNEEDILHNQALDLIIKELGE